MPLGLLRLVAPLLVLALVAGCSHEETRLDRLARASTVNFETSGGEAPPVPDMFHGRVGMRWTEIDAACTEGGGHLLVVGSDLYRCEGLPSPFRMQRTDLVETYHVDAEQRCDAAYYEIRVPSSGVVRHQTRRYSPLEAARIMFVWVVNGVGETVPLERKSSTRYQSSGKWVRVLREGTNIVVEVGVPGPRR